MRLIQPIFASYSTRETSLGEDNKIYNAWKEVNERVKKDIDLGVKEFLLFYIPEFKLGEKSSSHRGDEDIDACLLYTSPSPRDGLLARMPSSA